MYQFWNEFYTQSQSSKSKTRGKHNSDYSDDEDESQLIHGLGGGAEIKLGYLYVNDGVIVELENANLHYLGERGGGIELYTELCFKSQYRGKIYLFTQFYNHTTSFWIGIRFFFLSLKVGDGGLIFPPFLHFLICLNS